AACQAKANEEAGREIEHQRRRRIRHQDQADGVKCAAGAQDAHGAEAGGNGGGKRTAATGGKKNPAGAGRRSLTMEMSPPHATIPAGVPQPIAEAFEGSEMAIFAN